MSVHRQYQYLKETEREQYFSIQYCLAFSIRTRTI
jgi:hypothetical protein